MYVVILNKSFRANLHCGFFKHFKPHQIKPLLVADFKMEVNKA
jgi:hypothetical protein